MILTLPLTILIEGLMAGGFALWQKKTVINLLVASLFANLLTQSLLWGVLRLFPGHYLLALFSTEFLIWLLESAMLYYFPGTRLTWNEALSLNLGMNLASLGIGWFLPV